MISNSATLFKEETYSSHCQFYKDSLHKKNVHNIPDYVCIHTRHVKNPKYICIWNTFRYGKYLFFSWRWGGSDPSVDAYLRYILHIPQMIWVWRATVEWYWQGKAEELGEKPVPVSLCPPQIPHGLTRERTRTSAERGRRLTTWAMARPLVNC
jgi:hypothetical protein